MPAKLLLIAAVISAAGCVLAPFGPTSATAAAPGGAEMGAVPVVGDDADLNPAQVVWAERFLNRSWGGGTWFSFRREQTNYVLFDACPTSGVHTPHLFPYRLTATGPELIFEGVRDLADRRFERRGDFLDVIRLPWTSPDIDSAQPPAAERREFSIRL